MKPWNNVVAGRPSDKRTATVGHRNLLKQLYCENEATELPFLKEIVASLLQRQLAIIEYILFVAFVLKKSNKNASYGFLSCFLFSKATK